ncbi:hypothetical protein GXB85_04785 [Cellulomonas sp. APG4]|uniref:DUF732 domain-containing protein n=1 Tax=Cellulomonas sp. APG4 TaxID=1538656 RepID=UPI00137A487B|nr:DUF732 domain-containing protein [Cellulomonas sp. APG4]NCT90270.1 hypothetical protein [Cellulomonas sp. APG4]
MKSEPAAEELEWPDDPDQRRFYEGVRGAAGWEESSATELDELGVATCRDLRGYSGDPALAVASMEAAYIENLGVEHGAAKGIVAAAIARWCPEVAG